MRLSALACACLSVCGAASVAVAQNVQPLNTITLSDVVVTGRLLGANEGQPLGLSVITQAEILQSGASTVNEALIRVLGIVGRQDFYGGGDYGLDLRGFGGAADGNQAIIVDGIKINEADLGGTRLAGIPIESVQRIEVVRGSGAVLYGEGATGGVIIITTKAGTGVARKTGGSLYAGVGSYGLRDLRGNATYANEGFSLDASAQQRKADNYRDNFKSDASGASLSAQWSGDWLRLGARLARDDLDTQLPGSLTAIAYNANPRQSIQPDRTSSIHNTSSGLFAEAFWADWRVTADAGWRTKALRSVSPSFTYAYDIKAQTYALRAAHTTRMHSVTNRVVLGTDQASWQRDTDGTPVAVAKQTSGAWYVRDELTLASTGTDLSAGLRTEQLSKEDLSGPSMLKSRQTAWELGVRQSLAKDISVYARAGRSFRLANVDEIGYTLPGIDLRPQISKDFELGVRYNAGIYKADARWYNSTLTNEIGYDPNAAGPYGPGSGANVNFDPTRRTGFELNASMEAAKNLSLSVNAALRKSQFTAGAYAGNDIALVAKRSMSLRAAWVPVVNHRLSGGINFVGQQRADFANQCSVPAYQTADVRYAYDWRSAEFALGITNLFNRQHYTQAFGCTAGVTNGIYPEAGRAATASVRFKF